MALQFGKKVQVGKFEVLKFSRSMSGKDVKKLRKASGIPDELHKNLQRGSLPFVKVTTISGSWGVEFCAGTAMYRYIDENIDDDSLSNIFTMFFADTTVFGDEKYWSDKGEALKEYMDRLRAKDITKEDDDKILDDEREYLENVKTADEMADMLRKEEKDEK